LSLVAGEIHKKQRKITMPIFAPAELRQLTPVFYEIAERLSNAIASQIGSHLEGYGVGVSAPLDMSEWMSRVALELVGCSVLGYSFDPLDSPHNNPYTHTCT
jgi:cytochrome P450